MNRPPASSRRKRPSTWNCLLHGPLARPTAAFSTSIPGSSGHGRNHCRLKMCQRKVGDKRNAGALQCGLRLEGGLLFAPSGWGHCFQMRRGHCASELHAAHQSWRHCPPPALLRCRNMKCTPRPFSPSLDLISLYLIAYL